MRTLHELAVKLQEYIIKEQEDPHNQSTLNVTKYNNLKLRVETRYRFPNVVITIGISEAVFNFRDGCKVEGGLGPDERIIKKWLSLSTTIFDLKEIYLAMMQNVLVKREHKVLILSGESGDAKKTFVPIKKKRKVVTAEEFYNNTETYLEEPEEKSLWKTMLQGQFGKKS